MKKIVGILIIILIFACIGFVNAEDIVLNDNSTINDNTSLILNDTILEDNSHIHTSVSGILSDSPIKHSIVTASGGSFSDLATVISGASSGDTIDITGDYTYNSGTDSSLQSSGISFSSKNLIFKGNGHTFNGLGVATLFNIADSDVIFQDLTFKNFYKSGNGGVITSSNSNFNFTNCIVDNVNSTGYGGLFYSSGLNDIVLSDSTFTNIKANSNGGLIYVSGNINKILINNSNFDKVISNSWGGVFYITGSANGVDISESNFKNIYCAGDGGVVYIGTSSNVGIFKSTFLNVSVGGTGSGGVVRVNSGDLVVVNSSFKDLYGNNNGAVFHSNGLSSFYVFNSTFVNLSSKDNGAGFKASSSDNIIIDGSTFIGAVSGGGGLVYSESLSGNLSLSNSIFKNIRATSSNGGVVYIYGTVSGNVGIFNSSFSNISCSYSGAAVAIWERIVGNISVINSNFTGLYTNTYWGGVVYVRNSGVGGNINLSGSKFDNFTPKLAGGVICLESSSVTGSIFIENCDFSNIYSNNQGGTIYVPGSVNGVNISNSSFKNIYSGGDGGVVYVGSSSNVGIFNSSFLNVTIGGSGSGGVVRVNSGDLVVVNSSFKDLYGNNNGAVFHSNGLSSFYVFNSTFVNLSSKSNGAGFKASSSANIIIDGSTVIGAVSGNGGFVYSESLSGNLTLSNSIFNNTRTTSTNGGFVYIYGTVGGNVNISNSSFNNITSFYSGGVVAVWEKIDGNVTIFNSTFNEINTITYNGGVVWVRNSGVGGNINILYSNFSNFNMKLAGGVISLESCSLTGDLSVEGCNFINMYSTVYSSGSGSVIFISGSARSINISNSSFKNIHGTGDGGAFYTGSSVSNGLSVSNSTFLNVTIGGSGSGGVIRTGGGDINILNSTFKDIFGNNNGGIVHRNSGGGNFLVLNSTFINVTANNQGGAFRLDGSGTILIANSTFLYVGSNSASLIYFSSGQGNITNNIIIVNDLTKSAVTANGEFNNNWWGLNVPDFNTLVTTSSKPESWFVMGFTNTTLIQSGSSPTTLLVCLNTIYNRTSETFTRSTYDLPYNRTVIYDTTIPGASFSKNNISFLDNVTNTISYSSIPSNWLINATIDYQMLPLGPGSLNLNITVSKNPVHLYEIVNYTLSLDTSYSFKNISISFNSSFIYIGSSGYGTYNSSTGIWFIDSINSTSPRNITISLRVPYNESLINTNVTTKVNTTLINDLNYLSAINTEKEVNVTVLNITGGSYTLLQALIDGTPTGGTLYVPFNVTYDNVTDVWLKDGMRLNKTITLIGNDFVISGDNQAGIFYVTAPNVSISDLVLIKAVAPYRGYRSCYRGGAIASTGNNLNITNCTFIDNYAYNYGAAIDHMTGDIYITDCRFINNSMRMDASSGAHAVSLETSSGMAYVTGCLFDGNKAYRHAALWFINGMANYNAFVDNQGYRYFTTDGSNRNIEYNWWGYNNPIFSNLIDTGYISPPQTWFMMNFTNLQPINSTGGLVNLVVSLDTIYNSTTGNLTNVTNNLLPNRTVYYNYTAGLITPNSDYFKNTSNTKFTYSSGLTTLLLNATIDNQTLNISSADISIIVNVTNNEPQLIDIVTYTINITNNGDGDARNIKVNFTIPSILEYISDTGYGNYSNTTGIWYIPYLPHGTTLLLNISGRVPFNYSLVNTTHTKTATVSGIYADFNNLNDNSTINITIRNRTGGSYTVLQYFIDSTPSGGTLNLNFNVTYDNVTDVWLKDGMRLNKTITLIGNDFVISGDNQAGIFYVTAPNVSISDLVLIKAVAPYRGYRSCYRGGAIASTGNNLNITNCTFIDNYAYNYGAAIDHMTGDIYITDCRFINNSMRMDASSGAHAVSLETSSGMAYVTGCLFDGNKAYRHAALWFINGMANYNAFVDNQGYRYFTTDGSNRNIEYNWWGYNNPNFNNLIDGVPNPETWVIMNFTNTTPITYIGTTATLLVTLNTTYNRTSNTTADLMGTLPARNLTFNWTTGTVSPSNTIIQNQTTATFNYPTSMPSFMINATIDNQTLWIGSADLEIIIIPNKNPVDDGDNITFTVMVINHGYVNASNVNITLTLPPPGLINITFNTTNGTFNLSTMTWELGDINASSNKTLIINATINNPGYYLIINGTINTSDTYDGIFTNNNYTCNVTVIQWSDLNITKNVSNWNPKTKDNITYTIVVYNHGPSTAINVTVFDNLSSHLIFINYTSTNGIYNATTGIWFIDNITPGSNETLNITVLINQSGITINEVNVSCPNNDSNLTNNYANVTFETAPLSDLWVTIDMDPQTSNFITFHIQAGNNGIEPANGTILELNISSLMVYVNHTNDGGVYGCSTGVWDIGYIGVNETVNLTLIVQLNFPANLNVTNITTSVNITSWSTDLYPENNTDNITFEAEIFGNFRLLQYLVDLQPANTVFVLPRSFAYDPINDAFKDTDTYDLINGVSIYKNLTIVNPDGYTIGGFGMARCLNITAPNTILDGLKIADGYSPLGAGLNIPASNVQILRSNFTNNVLWGDYGGAIFVSGNNVLIQDNYFSRNNASKLGGGVGAVGANNLRILNNTFINNTAKSDDISGGAIGLINTQATVNTNVFLDNAATSSYHIGSAIYTNNSNVNLEANWYGNNTPNMTNDELISGDKPETWIILDWEIVNPNMTGVELNVVFVLYNGTSGEKTPINYGLPYRNLKVTSRDPTLSGYNTTYTGNNSVNYTYNTAIPTYQINATVDYETITLEFNTLLNVYKTLVNDTIWFGDDLIYNITIVNYGPHDTSIINLTDFLPSDLIINSITPSVGTVTNDTDNVYWLVSVPAGVNATLIINATPTVEGNYTNNITINTTTPLDYFINGTNRSVFGQVLSLSDLEVNLTISSPPYYVGGEIVYNLRVANYGPSTAYNIVVNMPVESGLTYLYQDWPGTYSQSTGLWNIASLNSGDILDINITFRINSPGWYNQTVNITSDSVDNNTNNNNKTVSFNVTSQVDLVLNMTINKNETLYGDNSVYVTLNVVNLGPGPADNVTVFTYFNGLGYLSASGYGSFVNDTPTAGRWLIGTLGVNITRTITLRFIASNVGNFTITGRANNTYNDSNWTNNYANVSISVLKYADLRITKTVSSSAVHVGDNITYTITVTNLAGFTVENVTVTDILDSRLYYDNNNPDYNGTDWFVGTVNVGETKTLTFNVTVTGNGTIWNNATVNGSLNDSNPNNNHVSISIFSGSLVSDLKITKTVNNTTPFLDENITYTITVTNLAGYIAENVTVYDPLPGVLVYDGNNPNFNGTEWFVGNLSVGETKNITFTVTVNGIGRIWNNVTVNSSLLDPNPNDNHDEVYIDVPFDGDLRISLSVIPNPPQANNPFIINVTVENCDIQDNNNVMVDFLLPASLTYINSTCMGSYNPITGKWNIGYLPASTKISLEIWVSPGVIGNVTIEGNVSGSVTDINPGNNRANLTFEIIPAFDLTITKTASNYSVFDGDTISFDISVWNNGPFVANNVKITDYLPFGLVYLFDNSSGTYYSNNRTADWTLPYLNNGDNITIHLIAKVQGPGLSFNNKVSVFAYGTDLNISDNTAYSGIVNVTQVTDLEVVLTASKLVDIDIGEIITFYVTVVNHGPSNASGVIADFLLPTDLLYVSDTGLGYYIPSNGTWYIGHLANGTNTTLTIIANLTNGGKYKLNATVNGSYYDNDTSNNIAFLNISSLSMFDLNITAYWNLTNNTMFWNDLAEYTVIIHNNGTDNATNVTVELTVPGVTYVNHTGPGTFNNITLTWDVGNLTVGEYKNITIIFNATSLGFYITKGNITAYGHDTNKSNNNYTLNLTILPVVDLVMTNITVNTTVTCVDGLLEFNVTVFNRGPCNATNTTILGLLPSGWMIVGGMTTGNIPVNSSEVFTIIVNASTLGNYSVGFNATINGRDLNITDNWMYFENITVIYACDLMITIKSNTNGISTGDIIVYTITVTNLDWRTAHNVTANVTIPTGLSLHHYYLASGEYNPSNGTWTIGNMSYRNSTTLFLFCTVNTIGDIEFWVNVTGDDYDFHLWNNNDTINITGTMGLDLNITITVDNSTPYTGDNITFTVVVENIGLVDASGVWVDISIPDGFVNPWSSDLNFTGSSYYIGNLNSTDIKTFNFTVTPIWLVNGTFNVSVGTNKIDYNLSNNFANVTVSPVGATDLQIKITSNNSTVMVGDLITYTITIYNNGTVDADNVMVYNNLPYSTVYSTSTPTYNPSTRLWIITNLSAGSIETLNITINHTLQGIYNYTVNITGDIIETNPTNNLDNITITVNEYSDLICYFTVNSTNTLDENILNFTITVFNNGTLNHTNVKVYTNLPSTSTYTNLSLFDTNLGIWDVGNFTSFENKTINLLVNLTQIGNFTFWANSTSKESDRNLSNNNQSLNITVYADFDIKVNITVNNNTPYLGDSVIFTINILNNGPSTAHDITVLNNITGTLLNLTKGTYAGNNWTIDSLASGETQTLNIQYTPTNSGISNYNTNITSDYIFFDRNTSNNQDNITLNISNVVDLIITITTNTTYANKTDLILYTVTIYNNGSNTANNVIIESDNLFDNILTYNLNAGFLSTTSWFIPTITGYNNATLNITKTLNTTTTTIVNVTSTDIELDNTTNTDNTTVTILKISDLLVTIDVNNTNPYITEEVTFTITAYNLGEDMADNVTVYLDLPYSTSYGDVYMYDSLQGIWNVGTLENNTNRTLNITLSLNFTGTVTYNATIISPNIDLNTTNNYDNVTLNITSLMDLSINITINTTNVLHVGDTVSFIVEVVNHGPADATGVNAYLNLPGSIQSITQGGYTSGVWSIGTLLKDQTVKLVLTRNLTLTDAKEYNINVTSPDTDKDLSNNNATLNLSIVPSSDLEIKITSSNTTVNIGEILVYNVTVINNGPNNVSSGIVNFTMPNLFNIISNMSSNGIFNGTHWTLTNLNSGDNATLLIYGNYSDGGNHTVTVFVNSTNYDRNMTNNYDNVSVFVNHACDLTVNFTSNLYYNLDGTITFNITITNKGPGKAENITIHTNLDNTNDYNNTIGYFDTLQNIWYIDSLSPGQTEILIINTTVFTDYLYFANATTDTPDLNNSDNIKFLNLTLTPLADLSINITMNNSNPHIGETVTFAVTVTNNGPCNATGVIVYTSLPASSVYVISKGLYDTLNGNWSIGNLSVGEIVTLNLTINITSLGDYTYSVNVTGSVNDTNNTNNNDTINFTVLPTADLEINILVNQTSFTVGDNVTFTITVTNNGPSDAENLTIGSILPVGFIPDISITEWNITSLNNGTNITLNLTGILTTNGTQEFKANVTSDTFDNDTTNNQNTLIFNVDNLVDLEISITANSTLVYAGEFINLLINLTNHGPGTAHNILVNTNITGATSTKNTGYYDTNTGYWFVETLNANTTEILNLTLRITENTTFAANIISNNTDINTSNNNASINITVLPLADLNITVKVSSLNLYFDEEITYEIIVTNNGYTLAEDVIVNTALNNTGFTFITSNSTSYDNLTGLWDIGNLSHNQTVTLVLKYKTSTVGYINHTFTVNTTTFESKLDDNTFNFTVFVNNSIKPTEGMVDLVINITVNNSLPMVNSTVTFNVTVFNNGSVEAHNLTINNTLPVGFVTVGAYTGSWNISNLSGYNSYSFTFTVNVTGYGSFVDNVTVDCSEWDIKPTNNRANQLIIIKESESEYLDLSINVTCEGNLTLGETFTYNITVTNHGPQDAIDVNCTIGLFEGLTVINSTSTDYNETLNLWNVGNLSSGSSKTLTLTVNITKTGSYTNVFIVWSGETDKNPQNNLQIDAFTINNTYVDVNIKITANKTYGNINDTILFTVTVTNPSSNPATNVNVTLDIPLEIVTFPSSDNTSYYIGELNSTQTVTFNFTAKINTTNSATVCVNVTINETDHNLLDNLDNITITPFNGNNKGVADLTVNITTSLLNLTSGNMEVNQYPEYGDVPYFTVWVTNHGPDNATNIRVPLTVPNGCSIMAQDAYWDNSTESFIVSNLGVNQTIKLEVSMLIETTDVLLINTTATSDQLDPNITDNTATISMYPFIPEPKCDLNVTVKVIGNEFFANNTVTFNITIRNDGQDIAYNVTVRNTVPTGLILCNITTYDTYTLNGDGWNIPQILPGASMQFLVSYNITKKGLYQTTVNVNSTIQDTDPTSNGMGVAFYAGEAEPPRREVKTKLNSPTVTTTAGKVQLAGGDWTFVGTLKFANNTAAPSSYTNFAGQTLYANVTDDAGVTRTYVSSTVTGTDGKATFVVPHADVGAGGTKFSIVIWYNGEKTSDDYYLPCVSSAKNNIKVVP